MNITHQLQGPLTSLIFSLSAIKGRLKSEWFQKEINFIKDLADDAIALSYGTFTSFAAEVGDASGFVPEDVDVVHEVRELAERLQRTTGRLDLEFEYKNSFEFETISIDHNLLTSVLYSLIHNAMKYADESTKVVLECGIERRKNVPGLKVKSVGAPIQPHESEKIFQKFGRGHLVKKTEILPNVVYDP